MAALVDFTVDDIGGIFTSIRESWTGERIVDPVELAKLDLQMSSLEQALAQGQISINKVEAAHKNLFVAGWRPFIGWVCGVSIAYAFLGQPLLEWFVVFADITKSVPDGAGGFIDVLVETPIIDSGVLFQLVLAMLGMAGIRGYEKKIGVARER